MTESCEGLKIPIVKRTDESPQLYAHFTHAYIGRNLVRRLDGVRGEEESLDLLNVPS